jgi:hypothetical protein
MGIAFFQAKIRILRLRARSAREHDPEIPMAFLKKLRTFARLTGKIRRFRAQFGAAIMR